MTSSLDLMGALLVGLAGAGHCIGMCGGVSAALSMAIPTEKQHFWGMLGYLLNYNLGRILSYVLAGALVGGLLATTTEIGAGKHALAWLRLIAALLMIALGLYLAGWWHGVLLLERIGAKFWPLIKPLAGRFLPFTSTWQALPFGMVWGWLPCGLVYSMLTWSAAAGSASGGALIMLFFGLGTLPTLFALGGLADRLRYWLTLRSLRLGGALLLIAYGIHTLWIGMASF
ncbi:sulfite exporter TauE/SafE family protein [Aeromonas caviae]|uniref:sulfite exporter TauE/SafE family protein n=1 Tax=Aeromonas caviae TaxID=648 RepID=UPI0038D0248D